MCANKDILHSILSFHLTWMKGTRAIMSSRWMSTCSTIFLCLLPASPPSLAPPVTSCTVIMRRLCESCVSGSTWHRHSTMSSTLFITPYVEHIHSYNVAYHLHHYRHPAHYHRYGYYHENECCTIGILPSKSIVTWLSGENEKIQGC